MFNIYSIINIISTQTSTCNGMYFKLFPCACTKNINIYNSLTSSHYQIEKGIKRKANEQIQHWLLLLNISHDIM